MPSWRSCDGAWATPSSHPRKSSTQSFACSTFQAQARCGFSKRDRPRRRQLCALHGAIRDATILFAVSITVGMSGRRRRRAFGREASCPRCISSSINLTTTISQRRIFCCLSRQDCRCHHGGGGNRAAEGRFPRATEGTVPQEQFPPYYGS